MVRLRGGGEVQAGEEEREKPHRCHQVQAEEAGEDRTAGQRGQPAEGGARHAEADQGEVEGGGSGAQKETPAAHRGRLCDPAGRDSVMMEQRGETDSQLSCMLDVIQHDKQCIVIISSIVFVSYFIHGLFLPDILLYCLNNLFHWSLSQVETLVGIGSL